MGPFRRALSLLRPASLGVVAPLQGQNLVQNGQFDAGGVAVAAKTDGR